MRVRERQWTDSDKEESEGEKRKQMLLIWKPKDIFQHVKDHGNEEEQIQAETHIMCPQWWVHTVPEEEERHSCSTVPNRMSILTLKAILRGSLRVCLAYWQCYCVFYVDGASSFTLQQTLVCFANATPWVWISTSGDGQHSLLKSD